MLVDLMIKRYNLLECLSIPIKYILLKPPHSTPCTPNSSGLELKYWYCDTQCEYLEVKTSVKSKSVNMPTFLQKNSFDDFRINNICHFNKIQHLFLPSLPKRHFAEIVLNESCVLSPKIALISSHLS